MATEAAWRKLLRRPDTVTFKNLEVGKVYKRLPSDEHEELLTMRITKKEEIYTIIIDLDREQDFEYGRSPYGQLEISGDLPTISQHAKLYDLETGDDVNIAGAKRGEYRVLLINPGTDTGRRVIKVKWRDPSFPHDFFEVVPTEHGEVLDVGEIFVDDVFKSNRIEADVLYTDPVITIAKTFDESPTAPRLYIPVAAAAAALENNTAPVKVTGLRKTLKNNARNRRAHLLEARSPEAQHRYANERKQEAAATAAAQARRSVSRSRK